MLSVHKFSFDYKQSFALLCAERMKNVGHFMCIVNTLNIGFYVVLNIYICGSKVAMMIKFSSIFLQDFFPKFSKYLKIFYEKSKGLHFFDV